MKVDYLWLLLSGAALLLVSNGCATHALWEQGQFASFREPAVPPHLRLFRSAENQEMLVTYDECREGNEKVLRRAYWLDRNRERLQERVRPHFVSPNEAERLIAVPVIDSPSPQVRPPMIMEGSSNSLPALYAVVSTNGHSFNIFSEHSEPGAYELPVYEDRSGRTKQILLTPLAILADLTIIGGCLAVVAWAGLAGSGWSP